MQCEDRGSQQLRMTMTQQDFEQKLDEVERLLNDPAVELEPARVWLLLDEVAGHEQVRQAA